MRYSSIIRLSVSAILATRVFSAPPSHQIIQASVSRASAATAELSPHSITVDHKNHAWEGKNWHYRVTNSVTGKQEEFTIYVVDTQFGDEHSGITTVSSRDSQLARVKRDLWVCTWAYGCGANPVEYAGVVTAAQSLAVGNAINDRLRANTNELMKRMFDGLVVGMSIAINNGTNLFYVTNKMLHRQNDTDICVVNGDWTSTVNFLKADIDFLATASQSGDFYPKTYDHYSHEEEGIAEGKHLRHATKISANSSSFNPLEC